MAWWLGHRTCNFLLWVQFLAVTLPTYFWDRWQSLVGKLSRDVTTTRVNSALHPSRVSKSSTSFSWGKGKKVTAAGWQVAPCDLIWHVITHSDVVTTDCYILPTYLHTTELLHQGLRPAAAPETGLICVFHSWLCLCRHVAIGLAPCLGL